MGLIPEADHARLFGEAWLAALNSTASSVEAADGESYSVRPRHDVVAGRWAGAMSESHARRAARVLALGSAQVGALFEKQLRVSRG